LDVTTFQSLIGEGKPASLREAVALYRGPYLEDVIWALPPEAECERRIMERLYADALRRLAVQTRGQEAMPYLEMLLAVEPSDEATHNTLVTSYLARGRRDLAQRQVTHWRRTLAEVDLEPSPEARALWLKVENIN
jgi:hypothetical protein